MTTCRWETRVFENPAIHSMRALARSIFDRIKWRHHGIGVLQGYIYEDCDPEVRLHIWSRKLLKSGMDVSGDTHDHRFDMLSHVLCGAVQHEEVQETFDRTGDQAMMALTHARAAASTKYHGPTMTLEGRFRVDRRRFTIRQGFSYTFPAEKFHRSPLSMDDEELVVTCVEKHQQRDTPARLLYPAVHEPVMAFGHDIDPALVQSVVSRAKALLENTQN